VAEVHGKTVPEEGKLKREISRKFLFSEEIFPGDFRVYADMVNTKNRELFSK
jgi:hypothetical protein